MFLLPGVYRLSVYSGNRQAKRGHSLAVFLLSAFACAGSHAGTVAEPVMDIRTSASGQSYWVEQITDQLNLPSSMAWLPDGDILVTERSGSLRRIHRGKLESDPLGGVPASFPSLFDGVKDIALDPDFLSNRTLYLYLTEGSLESRHAVIYKARYAATGLTETQRIFKSKDSIGGMWVLATRMMFKADRTLLFAMAEDHTVHAQDLGSHIGKILRINRDGSIPTDNPFLQTPGALPEIWAYGVRTPSGLYEDPQSGEIWETEIGPRGGDEINLLKAGANYGWAKASWGFSYNNRGLLAPLQSGPGLEDPLQVYTPSVSPAGITRYRGSAFPSWQGDFFIGQLGAGGRQGGRAIERLRFSDYRAVHRELLLFDLDERFRDVKVGPDQRIYLLTDSGRLLRLQPGRPARAQKSRLARKNDKPPFKEDLTPAMIEELRSGDATRGRQSFLQFCAACHSVGDAVKGGEVGPNLLNIYNSNVGIKTGYEYSEILDHAPRQWDFLSLNKFIADPAKLYPGTKMASPPIDDFEIRRNIVAFLRASTENPGD